MIDATATSSPSVARAWHIEPLKSDRHSDWNRYVAQHPDASAYHALAWRDVVARIFGHDTPYLVAIDASDRTVGALPLVRLRSLVFGHFLVSMPFFNYGGAIGDSAEIEEALMVEAGALARRDGARHVEFRDVTARADSWPCRDDKVAMELELPNSADALWKQIGSKVRAQVKRPQREPIETVVGRRDRLDEFYRVFARNMRDLGTPVYAKRFLAAALDAAGEEGFIVVIRHERDPVAAALLIGHRDRLEIPWASSLREFNRLGVNMLLYWEVLKQAVERGYRRFDFGRSTRDAGTYRFKKQWGAQPIPLHWHYWLAEGDAPPALNPDNPKYRLAIRAWQRLPVPVANTLGPSIVRNLP